MGQGIQKGCKETATPRSSYMRSARRPRCRSYRRFGCIRASSRNRRSTSRIGSVWRGRRLRMSAPLTRVGGSISWRQEDEGAWRLGSCVVNGCAGKPQWCEGSGCGLGGAWRRRLVALGARLDAFPSVGNREYEIDQTTTMVQTVQLVVVSDRPVEIVDDPWSKLPQDLHSPANAANIPVVRRKFSSAVQALAGYDLVRPRSIPGSRREYFSSLGGIRRLHIGF